jgi:hypothetical protein
MEEVRTILKLLSDFGALGVIVLIWWKDRKDLQAVLDTYKDDMSEMRDMYKTNVSLVKDYHSVASDLRQTVVLNTQMWAEVRKGINENEFCPIMRKRGMKAVGEVQG